MTNHIEDCKQAGIDAAIFAHGQAGHPVAPCQCMVMSRCLTDKNRTNTAMELMTVWADAYREKGDELSGDALREAGYDFQSFPEFNIR